MSDDTTVTTSAPTETTSAAVELTPTVTVTPAVVPVVDCADTSSLMKFALTKFAEVELQTELSLDDKIKQVAEALKAEIRKADITPAIRMDAIDWCDDALPHVIKAVDFVKAEINKAVLAEASKVEGVALAQVEKVKEVALAEVKKCCPSFFAKKV